MHAKRIALAAVATLALALPATALADYGHITQPGESLTSIAAADGLSVDALAAANGLSPTAELTVGQVVEIPPLDALTAATSAGAPAPHRARTELVSAVSTSSGASYIVQAGDTLSAIAARAGTSLSALARLNDLNPNDVLYVGRVLVLPSGSSAVAATSTSSAAASGPATGPGNQQIAGDTSSGPYPTDQYVTGAQVGDEASAGGVDPSLAEAIGWQESGYDNDVVSPTGAVGVMQIEPATWSWINQVLRGGATLDPSSAYDNVAGGVDLLHDLLAQTGSESEATAAYYQGLESLREYGMYPSTQQYVQDVQALQARFGG